MRPHWKGREAITPELILPFEAWEADPWRAQLSEKYSPQLVERLEILAFDRANELTGLDLGYAVSTNWPARYAGFTSECALLLRLDPTQERAMKCNFEIVVERLSKEARHTVSVARRSMTG